MKSEKNKIIYIGADNINDIDKEKIINCLNQYGCINYQIKFIQYSDYPINDNVFHWHREWIEWSNLFIN
jgi:hypothetical protein